MCWTPDREVRVRTLDEVIVLCSWERHFTLTVPFYPLSINRCQLTVGQGNLMKFWGVTCDGLASHPGGVVILLVTSCYRKFQQLDLQFHQQIIMHTLCITFELIYMYNVLSINHQLDEILNKCKIMVKVIAF